MPQALVPIDTPLSIIHKHIPRQSDIDKIVKNIEMCIIHSLELLIQAQDLVQSSLFSTNYAKFFCLFLLLCINVLCDFGECCESVPLDCTGSYISISINITKILACVVQVDGFIISL